MREKKRLFDELVVVVSCRVDRTETSSPSDETYALLARPGMDMHVTTFVSTTHATPCKLPRSRNPSWPDYCAFTYMHAAADVQFGTTATSAIYASGTSTTLLRLRKRVLLHSSIVSYLTSEKQRYIRSLAGC